MKHLLPLVLLSFAAQAARLSPHDENIRTIDRETARSEKLKKDFAESHIQAYCPGLTKPMPLACFAAYLESRSTKGSVSLVEAAYLTEVAKNLTIARSTANDTPAIGRFENAVNFLSLLSGVYIMSSRYKSLVPAVKNKNSAQEKYEVDQLESIERQTAGKFHDDLKEKLVQLTSESRAELKKFEDSDKKKELEERLLDIQKTAAF